MNHWQLFTNSFGKMLHPTLWVYGFLIALAGGVPGVVVLYNNQKLLSNPGTLTPQTMLTSFGSLLGVFVVIGVIATVAAPNTSYVDDSLPAGFAVYYRVQAQAANTACESGVSACVASSAN